MTREQIYSSCLQAIGRSNCLLLESATGTGKTRISINLINHLCDTVYKGKKTKMLLLVAKTVHKQTWKEEFQKWGGIHVDEVVMECYESLHKHTNEHFTFLLLDEVHHVGSELRLTCMKAVTFDYLIGLSATIPRNLKLLFKYSYRAQVVSCDIVEAIEDEILPEPEILLFPLKLDNTQYTETIEINTKAPGPVININYREMWKYKKHRVHALVSCTQKQKSNELNSQIQWEKNQYMRLRNRAMEQSWLFHCGKRLEFYADCKLPLIRQILEHLKHYRTITFCKTIQQAESVGKHCIHSKNGKDAERFYNEFNAKKINHITAVNILNENANLVDCKYGIFCNLSSSEVIMPQRQGRVLRHKHPVMIVPYYEGTREEELVEKAFANYDKKLMRTIHSINEI